LSQQSTDTLSVVVDREFPRPPDKVWQALTLPTLIEQWLMKNDFEPVVGHRFRFTADWGSVDCQVLAVEPDELLSYTWSAFGLESVVTWTLAQTDGGTLVHMEQAGFRPDQPQVYDGAKAGWQQFFAKLEQVVADA